MDVNKNELITWSNTFSCGIKIIDDQHMELVNIINDMYRHVSGSEDDEHEYLLKIIHKVFKYIKIHFATEEKIMRAANFAGFVRHKNNHDSFIITVMDIVNEVTLKKRVSLHSFTKYLKEWVFSHIAVVDKQYFEYFRKIATRKANGRLSITPMDVRSALHTQKSGFPMEMSEERASV